MDFCWLIRYYKGPLHTVYSLLVVLTGTGRSLQKRLDAGETILCAEGYVMGLARRGYIGTGVWTGQFMLDYPEALTSMHYEFVHCGSDVVQALQVNIMILKLSIIVLDLVNIKCLHVIL